MEKTAGEDFAVRRGTGLKIILLLIELLLLAAVVALRLYPELARPLLWESPPCAGAGAGGNPDVHAGTDA